MSEIDVLRPWEQRDDEPDHCYRAFKHFRDQKLDDPNTDRTLLEATRRYYEKPNLKKTHDNILRWSKLYDWRERARAWDRYLQRRVDEAAAQGRADVAARERGVTIADLEARQLELSFKLAGVLLEKLEDPTFTDQIRPKDLTAGMRAITEFLNVMAKTGALRAKDHEHEKPLTDEEMEIVDELFDQIIKRYSSEEKPEGDSEQHSL